MYPYGAIELENDEGLRFKVNGQRVKIISVNWWGQDDMQSDSRWSLSNQEHSSHAIKLN